MKTKQGNMGIGVGGVSILAIFVVLCLATLAALSLVSAQADYSLAEKTAGAAAEYYRADTKAEETLAKLIQITKQNISWEKAVEEAGFVTKKTDAGVLVSYTIPIDEIKTLEASIRLTLDEDGVPTGKWVKERWQTKVSEESSSSGGTLNLLK